MAFSGRSSRSWRSTCCSEKPGYWWHLLEFYWDCLPNRLKYVILEVFLTVLSVPDFGNVLRSTCCSEGPTCCCYFPEFYWTCWPNRFKLVTLEILGLWCPYLTSATSSGAPVAPEYLVIDVFSRNFTEIAHNGNIHQSTCSLRPGYWCHLRECY